MNPACNVSDDEKMYKKPETWQVINRTSIIFSVPFLKKQKNCLSEIAILFYSNSAICVNQTLNYLVTNK